MSVSRRDNDHGEQGETVGHPIHPMLVVFPLGLLATAVIFDAIALGRQFLVGTPTG